MKAAKYLLLLAVAFLALPAVSSAQTTVSFTAVGSSGLFLEVGQAAYSRAQALVPLTTFPDAQYCTWTTKDSIAGGTPNEIFSFDQAPAIQNTGNFWVVWTTTDAGSTCAAPSGHINIWSYLQTDSVVGDRCVFRTGSGTQQCVLSLPAPSATTITGTAGANLIKGGGVPPTNDTSSLPTTIVNALNGQQFGVAGTDIRPEDALFAIIRGFTAKGVFIGSGTQYAGMGYASSSTSCVAVPITGGPADADNSGTAGSVTAAQFALPGGTDPCSAQPAVSSFTVTPVGAAPVVVAVNITDTSSQGFGNPAITNINRGQLGEFLAGGLCQPVDLLPQVPINPRSKIFALTLLREPFSGTYNTIEYSMPNSTELHTSQENGATASDATITTFAACNKIPATRGGRERVTGTGNMIAAIKAETNSLGYAFWSVGNFAKFTNSGSTPVGAKYLTVDGVDPLQATYSNGCIPTATSTGTCALSNVTLQHVADGSYPIWSLLRLVTTSNAVSAAQLAETKAVAAQAQNQLSSSLPDFVPITTTSGFGTLKVVHSHFVPPAISTYKAPATGAVLSGTVVAANGDYNNVLPANPNHCAAPESGGDAGGIAFNLQADGNFCLDFGNSLTTGVGIISKRQ